MNSVTSRTLRLIGLFLLAASINSVANADNMQRLVKAAAIKNGFAPAATINPEVNSELAALGSKLFESEAVSLNGDVSCQTCHLDEFGSSDGMPNSIGVNGEGEGPERVYSKGAIIPRNSLALWGTGGIGYNVLFWDGRVDASSGVVISQFGDNPPSQDPLVVAAHLPVLVIREMLKEDQLVSSNKNETLQSAENIYKAIADNVTVSEPELTLKLLAFQATPSNQLTYEMIATAIAEFIRENFAISETKFSNFVFNDGKLSDEELQGAELFYGKGKCSVCHSGPYLTDFSFHAIATPQVGFGINGFGIDYGRYNATHNPSDLYIFRTPPLYNVSKTGPYGHSGSIASLDSMIVAHFDPLQNAAMEEWTTEERVEFYKKIAAGSKDILLVGALNNSEVKALTSFLNTLEL